ncbi:hypothetical protein K438DRAFT_1857201 [Mycena galopus ATCC 62051]|nr:hypothetical protein K438DRAFT_1857201 [Mycena galopus ATCC 62051]
MSSLQMPRIIREKSIITLKVCSPHSRNRRITSALARKNEFNAHPRSVPPAVASTPRLVDCREALGSISSERPKSRVTYRRNAKKKVEDLS